MLVRQVFWLGMGATVGVLTYRRAVRLAEALTPEALAHSAHVAFTEIMWEARTFADDVRAGMELHAADPGAARLALPAARPAIPAARTPLTAMHTPNGTHL